jgi:hypothetical protein
MNTIKDSANNKPAIPFAHHIDKDFVFEVYRVYPFLMDIN